MARVQIDGTYFLRKHFLLNTIVINMSVNDRSAGGKIVLNDPNVTRRWLFVLIATTHMHRTLPDSGLLNVTVAEVNVSLWMIETGCTSTLPTKQRMIGA